MNLLSVTSPGARGRWRDLPPLPHPGGNHRSLSVRSSGTRRATKNLPIPREHWRFNHGRGCFQRKDGGLLPVAILLALVAAFWIGGVVHLGQTEIRVSERTFHLNSCLNLAEGAAERAIHAINADDWSGWQGSSGVRRMPDVTMDLGRGTTGIMRAEADLTGKSPRIVAEGSVTFPNRPPISRQIEVLLERRTLFANAMTTRNSITFKGGNVVIDSYSAVLGPYGVNGNRGDKGSLATSSVSTESFSVGNAHVYGYIAVGGTELPKLGPNAVLAGLDDPPGTRDYGRVTFDFAAEFPIVQPTSSYHMPLGKISDNIRLGTPDATEPTIYLVDAIDIRNRVITIAGPVELQVIGDVKIGGNSGGIVVEDSGRATIFAEGNVDIGGHGAMNKSNDPARLQFYGTASGDQSFTLSGSSDWATTLYAPNASIELKGGGSGSSFYGAIVGKDVTLNGNYKFHFDESLGARVLHESYRLHLWKELFTTAARNNF